MVLIYVEMLLTLKMMDLHFLQVVIEMMMPYNYGILELYNALEYLIGMVQQLDLWLLVT